MRLSSGRSVPVVLVLAALYSAPTVVCGQLPPLPPIPPPECSPWTPGLPGASAGIAILTLAGPREANDASVDGIGRAARFRLPRGIAADGRGNVFVADWGNGTIRKIAPGGAVTTLAGRPGHRGFCDGAGDEAGFNSPLAVAADGGGNVYVVDSECIRRVTPAGFVTTLAGGVMPGSLDGTGSASQFFLPSGLTVARSGNVYVADKGNHTIRKATPAGVVTTIAGLAGNRGSDDGSAASARFYSPTGIAVDDNDNVYVTDTDNHTLRKIDAAGAVTTFAGLAGSPGNTDGTARVARFNYPETLAIDRVGDIYVCQRSVNGVLMRKVTPSGDVTTVGEFKTVSGMTVDGSGNIHVMERGVVRTITASGEVMTLAGTAGEAGANDGVGTDARFSSPNGIGVGLNGDIYVADAGNHTIRRITPAGEVITLAGKAGEYGSADGLGSAAQFSSPSGLAADSSGNFYVADRLNSTIRRITPDGAVTTFAGRAQTSGSVDGPAAQARFNLPSGVAVDRGGNVYVVDSWGTTIRKVTPSGVVTTLAGRAITEGFADGVGSAARFFGASALAVDDAGNIYVVDASNKALRKVTPSGAVTTINTSIYSPSGIAIASNGIVYVTTAGALMKGNGGGSFEVIAGSDNEGFSADGMGTKARFLSLAGVAVDGSGNVYLTDAANHSVRVGRAVLTDAAAIDVSKAAIGAPRQLDARPQTASAWEWQIVRRPADSVAQLSSSTGRNPTFTPDVTGLFTFRLVATTANGASISTVDFMATPEAGGVRRRAVR